MTLRVTLNLSSWDQLGRRSGSFPCRRGAQIFMCCRSALLRKWLLRRPCSRLGRRDQIFPIFFWIAEDKICIRAPARRWLAVRRKVCPRNSYGRGRNSTLVDFMDFYARFLKETKTVHRREKRQDDGRRSAHFHLRRFWNLLSDRGCHHLNSWWNRIFWVIFCNRTQFTIFLFSRISKLWRSGRCCSWWCVRSVGRGRCLARTFRVRRVP